MSSSAPERFRFEVALSFAGDNKRGHIRAIAEYLEAELGDGKVFFDEWFEAELAGTDADLYLQTIYRRSSRLVVTCVCRRYNEKPWTQDEWRAIRSLERSLREGGADAVKRLRFLPLRFGDGEVDGLFDTAIIPDKRSASATEIAEFILKRLQILHEHTDPESSAATTGLVASPMVHSASARKARIHSAASAGTRPAPNPFQSGGALRADSPTYIVRACDNELHAAIKSVPLIAVVGEFEIGKSSLLARTRASLRSSMNVVIRDLDSVRTDNERDFVDAFFSFFVGHVGLVQSWESLANLLRERRTLILLDEFAALPTPVAAGFVPKLFRLSEQLPGRVSTVVTMPQPIDVFLATRGLVNPKYRRGWVPIQISTLTQREVLRLLNLLPVHLRDAAIAAVETVMHLSLGHPRRVQSLCARLFSADCSARVAELVQSEDSYDCSARVGALVESEDSYK